ncbi:hypothetical protein MAPG_11943 [Magnaporthiopsis poae ATCC 64411]|uniref:Fungal-type protein kinase domain-containing protein n=1 Tax=Magnaporthiopsis poae (strain ATCC 64411 / 73-15) TaxID=644358 RepID=A0A0C4EGJ0_MAGP6|nr:hypothetical protein MAPG_11943 [Magnaporthiopsis poae ATCC 64411]
MANQQRSQIIQDNPIGDRLDSFRASFDDLCADKGIPRTPDPLGQLDLEDVRDVAVALLFALQNLQAARLLPSSGRRKSLYFDLTNLGTAVGEDDFDFDRIKPLLNAVLANHAGNDALIWDRAYEAVIEATPPPRPIPSPLQQTPWLRNTGSFPNSAEHRKYIDDVLKEELGQLYVGLPDLYESYFGGVPNLETASKTFFERCLGGSSNPLFSDGGWRGWPEDANQKDTLRWLADFTKELAAFAKSHNSAPAYDRGLLAMPDEPITGSVAQRKMDVGFVDDNAGAAGKNSTKCHWSQILVPGELKSNPHADRPSEAWLDIGRYAREVFAAQDTRRFVLGFTLCGSLMRIWVFDRLGGIASERFDINKDGQRFVSTFLGFLWMTEEELGFDPTIMTTTAKGGQRFIEIDREGTTERLILDGPATRARCIAGRATTCWKAYREKDPDALFVVKDSWQYVERDEEGELLREATSKGAVHVARYYHHETVRVRNADDDVRNNVRKALDVTKAANYPQNPSRRPPSRGSVAGGGAKQSSHGSGASLPPSKRPRLTYSAEAGGGSGSDAALQNRVHRRVILCDWGIPIYKAGSREVLLAAMADCIEGHRSLRQKAGLLHRDISIGNLMIGKDNCGFLIDLDLAIKEQRLRASGAKGKTGTRAFMAIGALMGERHSFMHDLESFFWVLFWICIHMEGPGKGRVVDEFDQWNYAGTRMLTNIKIGEIADESKFVETAKEYFTPYHKPMVAERG